MKISKSSLSRAESYKEIAEFWDTHDLSNFCEKTRDAHFNVQIAAEVTYYAIEKNLSEQLQSLALKRGVTADTLINLWIQEKLQEKT